VINPLDYQKMLVMSIMWAVICGIVVISTAIQLRNKDTESSDDPTSETQPPKNNTGRIILVIIFSIMLVIAIIAGSYLLINKKSIMIDYN